MTPTLGRIVLATGSAAEANGAKECPAIITRVWSHNEAGGYWVVNLTLVPDCAEPRTASSAYLYDTEQPARDYSAPAGAVAAFWPPRV